MPPDWGALPAAESLVLPGMRCSPCLPQPPAWRGAHLPGTGASCQVAALYGGATTALNLLKSTLDPTLHLPSLAEPQLWYVSLCAQRGLGARHATARLSCGRLMPGAQAQGARARIALVIHQQSLHKGTSLFSSSRSQPDPPAPQSIGTVRTSNGMTKRYTVVRAQPARAGWLPLLCTSACHKIIRQATDKQHV